MSPSHTPSRLVFTWALAAAALLLLPAPAEANFRFRFRGSVSGGGRVHAPRIRFYPRPILPWWPTYVIVRPPNEASPSNVAPPYAPGGPSTVAAVQPRPALNRYALGGFIGVAAVGNGEGAPATEHAESALTVRARLADHWHLEGSLRQTQAVGEADERRQYAAASLLAELAPYASLSPYVLAGLGSELGADASYVEVGGGLRLHVGPSLELSAELRGGVLTDESTALSVSMAGEPSQSQPLSRALLGAMVRF